jgi:hypothetical protein
MTRIRVDVPALASVGHQAAGYASAPRSAKHRLSAADDDVAALRGRCVAAVSDLSTVHDVWGVHLGTFGHDLSVVGHNLVDTATIVRSADDAAVDLFQPISPADRHHYGIRP